MRPGFVVPAKAASFPAVPIVVPRAALRPYVGDDQELVLVLYDPRVPVPTLRVSGQASALLDVRARVLRAAVEPQHRASP